MEKITRFSIVIVPVPITVDDAHNPKDDRKNIPGYDDRIRNSKNGNHIYSFGAYLFIMGERKQLSSPTR